MDMLLEAKREAASRVANLLRAFANEDRLLLLCHLSQGEMSVSDIEQTLGIRQPSLSQQLSVLRNDGLVATRRDGKRIFYHVTDDKTLSLLDTLFRLYCPSEGSDHAS